ncbi:MAG TPA: hypothetical protein VG455_04940 [Acidimicrobiales bacterium]|nr:hypothetical protein [Acidimicrobiales bacterium]
MARKPLARLLVLPALVLLLLFGSCAPSEFRYVSHSSTNTYLKVPRDWKAYDGRLLDQLEAKAEEFGGEQGPSFVDQAFQGSLQWRVAYDGDEDPEPGHVVSFAEAPVVEVRVRELNQSERDRVSLAALRNIFFPYDELKAQLERELAERPLEANPPTSGSFRPLLERELNFDGGVRGSRLRFEIREGAQFYMIDQTALLDGETNRVHVLLMRASEEQFVTHRKLLDEIAESFTVKEKD